MGQSSAAVGGQEGPGGFRRIPLPTDREAEDRQLTAVRQRMGRQRTRTINKIKHLLRKHNLEQQQPPRAGYATDAEMAGDVAAGTNRPPGKGLAAGGMEVVDDQLARLELGDRKRASEECDGGSAGDDSRLRGTLAFDGLADQVQSSDFRGRPSLANYWGLTPGCRNSGELPIDSARSPNEAAQWRSRTLGHMVLHVLRRNARMKAWHGRIKRRRRVEDRAGSGDAPTGDDHFGTW